MKSSKIFRKSEDLYKYIEDLNVIFRSEIKIREINLRTEHQFRINVQCNEWISKWINLLQKQIQNTKQWSLPFLSWSQHPLTCTQRFEEDTKQIIRISQISQYTEVKSEKIVKKSKDIQGFHQYILKYPQNMNHKMHIPVTKWHTYIRDVNWQVIWMNPTN